MNANSLPVHHPSAAMTMNPPLPPMSSTALPPRRELLQAIDRRDPSYEGIFITAVKTTGTLPADLHGEEAEAAERRVLPDLPRRPVRRLPAVQALPAARARRQPAAVAREVLAEIETDPARRWRDQDLRDLGLEPDRVRRWFQKHHGMTFHAYTRSRRLGEALGTIQSGAKVIDAAFDHGFESLSGFNEAFRRLTGRAPTAAADAPRVLVTRLLTPLGPMIAAATEEALTLLEFADRRMLPRQLRRMTDRLRSPSPRARPTSTSASATSSTPTSPAKAWSSKNPPRRRRHSLAGHRLAQARRDPRRHHHHLRQPRPRARPSHRRPSRRPRRRRQPHRHPRPLPPGGGQQRQPHRLRRWAVAEAAVARGRRRGGERPETTRHALAEPAPPQAGASAAASSSAIF